MKYDVTIFDDGRKLRQIESYLKKHKVKFKTIRNDNDFGVHGAEVLGYEVHFITANVDILDELKKCKVDASIVAYKPNFKKFYKMTWKHKREVDSMPKKESKFYVPF